jgi:hypothetical protein
VQPLGHREQPFVAPCLVGDEVGQQLVVVEE